jgi:hypothetical protein
MKIQTIIVDEFYKNPDEVRAFALSQNFEVSGNYPGHRTRSFLVENVKNSIQEIVRPYAGEITGWGDDSTGSFQFTTARDRSWIHSDDTTDWAAVLYLTPDAPLSAGTGLFKHKETGAKRWRSSEHSNDENSKAPGVLHSQDFTKWEMVDRIGNVYNRMVLYRGDLFHVSLDYFGNDKEDGRLFQVFFFNTEK